MPTGPYETLLTTDELAAHLRISRDTVEEMEKRGQLPKPLTNKSKPGRGRCIKRWDLWKVGRFLDGTDKDGHGT